MAENPAMLLIKQVEPFPARGYLTRIAADHLEASGPLSSLGDLCRIRTSSGCWSIAEVTAVTKTTTILVPLQSVDGARIGDEVFTMPRSGQPQVGHRFAGRVVNALGMPIDGGLPIANDAEPEPHSVRTTALDRVSPDKQLVTGVRAIDGLLTLGVGQRVGIFAASGVGKSRLVEQLARQIDCDHVVICHVGERGREVEALWSGMNNLGQLDRTTLVAATSDESAPMRVRCVRQALDLAEFWRSNGRHVLLIVDSVTRLAMALREIGLASGEPPTVRAYTPNVFSALPDLVERCGALRSGGSITAVFTVLAETDDVDDPIVEVMKSLLDGHIILSRTLAQAGHFPAIDMAKSISRLATDLAAPDHLKAARQALALLGRYEESKILIESGLYTAGSNVEIDRAIKARPKLLEFLRQGSHDRIEWSSTLSALSLLGEEGRG